MDHSEVKHLPKVDRTPAKIEKFSEAIRLGALLSGPAVGVFVDARGNTCAQGAALLAVGRLERSSEQQWMNHSHMEAQWPSLPPEIRWEAVKMNNEGTHTRQEIADWLESQGY